MTLCSRYCCQDFFFIIPQSTKTSSSYHNLPGSYFGVGYVLAIFLNMYSVNSTYSRFSFVRCVKSRHISVGENLKFTRYMTREGCLEAYRCEIVIRIQSLFVGQSTELTANGVIHGKYTDAIVRRLQQEE